jgi:hypothetical protein
LINWEAFRDTLKAWVDTNGFDFVQSVFDQEGFMTHAENRCLNTLIVAFFLQGDKAKRNELLTMASSIGDNIEQDLEHLSVEGIPQDYSTDQFKERLAQSKLQADQFSTISQDLTNGDKFIVAKAIDRLRQMFEVIDCLEGS